MRRDRGQKRIPYGVPKDIVLLATPSGWRHSTTTADGTFICGRLSMVPADADAEQAKGAAAAMVAELGREFHAAVLDVLWEAGQSSGSWIGRIRQLP